MTGECQITKELTTPAKPFIKWAGGKNQLLKEIRSIYPSGLGNEINKYAEPFIGGGAVLFDILSRFELDEVYISDINKELISVYETIRDRCSELIDILEEIQTKHLSFDEEARKNYFYENRDRYNKLKDKTFDESSLEIAALFIYLNKTCFNGLYRVNSKGQFNVPSGVYKNPLICDKDNLFNVSIKLQGAHIVNGDYRDSIDFIDENTFVYFDPPYRPLTSTASFTAYTKNLFDDESQRDLAEYVKKLTEIGAKVVVSNSDPKNHDVEDNFFDNLYAENNIERISANRMINSKGGGRGKINELLITNYPIIKK